MNGTNVPATEERSWRRAWIAVNRDKTPLRNNPMGRRAGKNRRKNANHVR